MYQNVSANKTYKKNCVRQFPILSALKLTPCVLVIFVDMNTYKGISKQSWKKIVQLIWAVVTYSLINVEYRIGHDIDSVNGVCIRHS